MSTSNRAQLIKIHKLLKRHYKPAAPDSDRPVLETYVYACCLENATFDAADKALAVFVDSFFDWNEVRVSTVNELAEAVGFLPDAAQAGSRVRQALQQVFEASYAFEMESFKKQKLGEATKQLSKIPGATPFIVSYVVQSSLGGHAIPLDSGTLKAAVTIGIVDEADAAKGSIPGLERAIPKNKGIEFGSLLHQLGADMVARPYEPAFHKILVELNPSAKDRLPKKPPKKPAVVAAAPPPPEPAPAKKPARAASDGVKPPEPARQPAASNSKQPLKQPSKQPPKPTAQQAEKPAVKKVESKKVESAKKPSAKPKQREPAAAGRGPKASRGAVTTRAKHKPR